MTTKKECVRMWTGVHWLLMYTGTLVDCRAHRISKLQTIELKLRKISCASDTAPSANLPFVSVFEGSCTRFSESTQTTFQSRG